MEMLETVIIILMLLWLIGLINGIAGGFIHLVLLAALIIFVVRFVTGRKTVWFKEVFILTGKAILNRVFLPSTLVSDLIWAGFLIYRQIFQIDLVLNYNRYWNYIFAAWIKWMLN